MNRVLPLFAFRPARCGWLLFACCLAQAAMAQDADKRADIARTSAIPDIDGQLMSGEWENATVIRDLHQVRPVEFADPSEETIWYVMYDATALYVAAVAYDGQPDRISAQMLRQGGSLHADDTVTVLIDAFNNKRSGYSFSVNPHGVREDGIFTSGTRLSDDWDGIWQSAAKMTANGWTTEMAIPFNTLTFDPENDVWGFNLSRQIQRKSETMAWNSRNGDVNPTVSGELKGMSGLTQGKGLDVIPSVSTTSQQHHIDDSSESDFRPSLDISYKLTPAINILLTLNTDFAATEVDGRQLDLSRFSLFFPEKRSFFLTDFDIFQFGGISTGGRGGGGFGGIPGASSGTNGLPFYSRRIGLGASRQPVDLLGGLKLSGRIGDTDFGALYVRQDEATVDCDPVDDPTCDSANPVKVIDASDLIVARVSHGLLSESSIGAIATSGDPNSNDSSSLVGVDFNYRNTRLANNRTLEGWIWVQKSDNDGLDGDDVAWSVALGLPAREGWELGGQIHEAQANYAPRLGFANRTGVRMYSGRIEHRWINDDSHWFQRVDLGMDFNRWEYLDTGLLQSQRVNVSLIDVRTASNDNFRMSFNRQKERLLDGENPLDGLGIDIPPGEYSFDSWNANIRTADHRNFGGELWVNVGDYYNGQRVGFSPGFQWRVNIHLAFEMWVDYTKFKFPGAEATTRQITLENEIAFNSSWSLLTMVQYDNLSNEVGINSRLRYNRAAGQDFWLVLNHNMREFEPDDPEYRSNDFRSVETVAALKFRYTFRF
jgi:hypothetical protein